MIVCAGIITYNPDLLKLKNNIETIYKQVNEIIIVDNGSKNFEEIQSLIENKNITIIKNDGNLGIARALNQVCEKAIENNYEWIITLDQDSVSPSNLISTLEKNINNDVAIIAPNIVYRNNEKYAIRKKDIEYVEWVITSASLTNLNIWQKIKFDEYLFIDGVDRDYCTRANALGYKIIKDYNAELLHELGELKCINLFGKVIYVTNHSPIRKYYMTRNVIYLDKKLKQKKALKTISKNIFKTIFFENNKIRKIKSISRGIKDSLLINRR